MQIMSCNVSCKHHDDVNNYLHDIQLSEGVGFSILHRSIVVFEPDIRIQAIRLNAALVQSGDSDFKKAISSSEGKMFKFAVQVLIFNKIHNKKEPPANYFLVLRSGMKIFRFIFF